MSRDAPEKAQFGWRTKKAVKAAKKTTKAVNIVAHPVGPAKKYAKKKLHGKFTKVERFDFRD